MRRVGAVLLLAAAAAPATAVSPSPANARRELARILARPEFAPAASRPREPARTANPPSWLSRWADAVRRWARMLRRRLFPERSDDEAQTSRARFAHFVLPVVIAAIVVAAGAAALFLVRARRRRRPTPGPRFAAPAARADFDDARRREPSEWERESWALFESGNWREAVRARYLGSLAFLAARGAIAYQPFKTNGEYLREISGAGLRPEGFTRWTRRFDGIWYGRDAVDAADVRRLFDEEGRWRASFPA